MRQFSMDRVFALDEDCEDLYKNTFLGVDANGDWFVLDRLAGVSITDRPALQQYRRDMADVAILEVIEENQPAEFFRDYWSFVCGQINLVEPYFNTLLVMAKKTQIFGIQPELV